MGLGVAWAWRLFWKMGPLITFGAEEEPGEASCVSPGLPTTHTYRAQTPLPCREGA